MMCLTKQKYFNILFISLDKKSITHIIFIIKP